MTVWGWIIISSFGVIGLGLIAKVVVEMIWNKRLNIFKQEQHIDIVRMPVERLIKYAYSFSLSAAIVVVSLVSGVFTVSDPLSPGSIELNKTLVNANQIGTEAKLQSLVTEYLQRSDEYWYLTPGGMEGDWDAVGDENTDTREYTDTNVQVDGVDEGDILKTDGYRVFYAPRYYNVIEVLDIEDNHRMTQVEEMVIDDFRVDSMYLTDDYLVVIGYVYEEMIYPMDTMDVYYGFYWYQSTASIIVFDKDTLDEVYRLETDLSFVDHRMIDDTLYIVSRKWFYEDQELRPTFDITQNGFTTTSYLNYTDMYYFDDVPAYSMTVIATIDLLTFEQSAQGFLGEAGQIYVTENSIYTYYSQWNYDEVDGIFTYDINTHIIKYRIDSTTHSISYVASATVDGQVDDRYWLDESDDYLRVVTSRGWWNDEVNRLYILQENPTNDTFDLVALMDENIGHENERVESVRFHGDYVNVVTYERMDPLYTIDLSNPSEPSILANPIEEAGYSEYLHVWDVPNHVLGLGYLDADEDSRIDGMKLSAYDTDTGTILDTDPYPYEDGSAWSYSYTEAMYNPKALMVDVDLGLFGFPMVSYRYQSDPWQYYYRTTFVVYQIDFDSNSVLGEPIMIEHETTNYYNQIDRGVYIEGYIYTFSAGEIMSYNLATQETFETITITYN